ncbi:MAG TPA: N-acetyltransferase family protein [Holophaga sp.]|nr:N-acetyltransferase family protein [Holophaga sp.]HPS68810.1 N-acetyltransferase family protein [Holophaga sp.]
MDITIESMTRADWKSVEAIYMEGIATGQATFEVEAPTWEQWDANHLSSCRFVARRHGQIAGWAALSPVSRRSCYAGVAEVSIYVTAGARNQGVGRILLHTLIQESERHGIWTLQGTTFPENSASLHLQSSCGFRVVGKRERIARQNGVWRDTLVSERRSPTIGLD